MNDNIKIFEQILERFAFRQPVAPEARTSAFKNKLNAQIQKAVEFGRASPLPAKDELLTDVFK